MKTIILLVLLLVLSVVCLLNKKINIFKILIEQFSIYKNDKTKKVSAFDIFTFIINPIFISVVLVFLIDYKLLINKADLFITILSIVSAILFSFLALLVEKKNSTNNEKEFQVSNETYISIILTIFYSIIAIILLIVLLLIPDIYWLIMVLNGICYYLLIKIIFHIMMVLKRMFLLLQN